MQDNIPACFRCGGAAGGPPPSTATGAILTTSIYETRLGLVALAWSRTVVGLSLRAELREKDDYEEEREEEEEQEVEPLRFHVRPWLFWKRRGSKRFHLKDHRHRRSLDIAWDLRRASFPPSGGPEPAAGFYVAISIDGEFLVVAGDLSEQAYKKIKAKRPSAPFSRPVLISRREHVALCDTAAAGFRWCHRTVANFGGREREVSIELAGREKERDSAAMSVCVDGEPVLDVRRLSWKFRGSEKVVLDGAGGRIQISWNLHDWLFQPKIEVAPSPGGAVGGAAFSEAEPAHAVFVFQYEPEEVKEGQGHFGNGEMSKDGPMRGYFGKNRNWSESSVGVGVGVGGGNADGGSLRRRRKCLRKTSSSSSSASSASSASSSTVMGWESQEEMDLQRADGYSLLVYLWKS